MCTYYFVYPLDMDYVWGTVGILEKEYSIFNAAESEILTSCPLIWVKLQKHKILHFP